MKDPKAFKDTKPKILLVDDRPENLVALTALIAADDVEVMTAISGNEALALLIDQEFALALLDVEMPGMDGFELARLMRSAERSRAIPIIFVTASQSSERQVFQGYEEGAVDYLLKPLNTHVVRSKVRVFIELARKTRLLEERTASLAEHLREVETLREAAEAASLAKSRFLANMSHEIRTPLAAVLGYADLLRDQQQPQEERENCIEAIIRNGRVLLGLVSDVLDLAKIEAERVEIERVPVRLRDLLTDLESIHAQRAENKGVALTFVALTKLPLVVQSDPLRLKQILSNLVSNAVKFTERGKVEVRLAMEGTITHPRLSFSVRDTGRGLSDAEAARLFRPFAQGDATTSRKFGGTGLGLTIARELARLLGGDVTLQSSAPGIGSTFVATIFPGMIAPSSMLPAEQFFAAQSGPAVAGILELPRIDGLKVLLVDDAMDNRHLLGRMLGFAGATVDLASDGAEAITKALAGDFDIVLMDIQMPGTDGYEATSRLRQQGYAKPIIAITAHALKEDLERCIAAGCDRSISKPVDRRLLLECIQQFTGKRQTTAPAK